MINACRVKLKIEIELYRTTKHENAYAHVSSKQERRQDQEAQSHRESYGL